MKVLLTSFVMFFLLLPDCLHAQESDATSTTTFKNKNAGHVEYQLPKGWKSQWRGESINFGTSFYVIESIADKEEFQLELMVNDAKHMQLENLTHSDLESYVANKMASAVPYSSEGRLVPTKFGKNLDGAYGALTKKAFASGKYSVYIDGISLVDNKVIIFRLNTNDKLILEKTLSMVESFTFNGNASEQEVKSYSAK